MRFRRRKHPALAIVAVVCLAGLEGMAIAHGLDGTMFAAVIAAIAGIAGYAVRPS